MHQFVEQLIVVIVRASFAEVGESQARSGSGGSFVGGVASNIAG